MAYDLMISVLTPDEVLTPVHFYEYLYTVPQMYLICLLNVQIEMPPEMSQTRDPQYHASYDLTALSSFGHKLLALAAGILLSYRISYLYCYVYPQTYIQKTGTSRDVAHYGAFRCRSSR